LIWPREYYSVFITAKALPLVFQATVLTKFIAFALSFVKESGKSNLELNLFTLDKKRRIQQTKAAYNGIASLPTQKHSQHSSFRK
jgi:uncharacterized protein (UPF0332 family)